MYNNRVTQQVLRHCAPPSPLILACTHTHALTHTHTLCCRLAVSSPCRPPVCYPFCASFLKPCLVLTHAGKDFCDTCQSVCTLYVSLHVRRQNVCIHIFSGVPLCVRLCVSMCVLKWGRPDHAFAVVLILTIHLVTCMFLV